MHHPPRGSAAWVARPQLVKGFASKSRRVAREELRQVGVPPVAKHSMVSKILSDARMRGERGDWK